MAQIVIDNVSVLTTPKLMMQAIDDNFDELYDSKVQVSIKEYGAVGDGVTDDSTAEDAAHAANPAVTYPKGVYYNTDNKYNCYSAGDYGLSHRIQAGLSGAPTSDLNPVIWINKISDAVEGSSIWDQGGLYVGHIKTSGDAFCTATTSYAAVSSGSGDIIGLHARSELSNEDALTRGYGIWSYINVNRTSVPSAAHAAEFNGACLTDPGWGGACQLLRLCMSDLTADSNRFSTAISIGRTTKGEGNNGFWTGISFETQCLVKTLGELDDGEVMNIVGPAGGDVTEGSVGGIRFNGGNFKYALRTDEAEFYDNKAIRLEEHHAIVWGSDVTPVRMTAVGPCLYITNGAVCIEDPESDVALQVGNDRILSPRRHGWTAASGTATRSTFATSSVTLSGLAERVKALLDDLIYHGLIGA